MDRTDCLWESSRSSDQLQRRRGGRTWTCCSVELQLDDVWRTVVDYERRHSRPACRSRTGTAELSDAGNETSWSKAWTWPAAACWANEVCCAKCQSVHGRISVFQWRHGRRRWTSVVACLWWLLETRRAVVRGSWMSQKHAGIAEDMFDKSRTCLTNWRCARLIHDQQPLKMFLQVCDIIKLVCDAHVALKIICSK